MAEKNTKAPSSTETAAKVAKTATAAPPPVSAAPPVSVTTPAVEASALVSAPPPAVEVSALVSAPPPAVSAAPAPKLTPDQELAAFHKRAVEAIAAGKTALEFAKSEGTLVNNVYARLYLAEKKLHLEGLEFSEVTKVPRKRATQEESFETIITLYKGGNTKVPYPVGKIPQSVIKKLNLQENDRVLFVFHEETSTFSIVCKNSDSNTAE